MAIKALYALACESIRQEANGKFIAIGIYSSSIVISSFPVVLSLQLFTKAIIDGTGKQDILFRVLVDGREDHQIGGELQAERAQEDWLPIPLQPINFQVPSVLSVEQKDESGSWEEFFNIRIERA